MTTTRSLGGRTACPGRVAGTPRIINTPEDLDSVQTGDILVASQTDITYIGALLRAGGVVTETGGRFSHAAIWARENGRPALVAVGGAREALLGVAHVTLNATNGRIEWEESR